MKQQHDLMQRILDEGYEHSDRTGVGRISLYNVFLDFNVRDSIPIVNTQKVFYNTAIKELLWMLGGHDRIDVPGLELPIWKKWALTDEGIENNRNFIKEQVCKKMGNDSTEEYINEVIEYRKRSSSGTVGKMYPETWRHAPNNNIYSIRPQRTPEELPSDLKAKYEKYYYNGSNLREMNNLYWARYDQINEVFLNLKKRPHSSRHRVSAWIPEWLPDEDKDSQYNILNGRGSLTPCHSFFQFTVGRPDSVTGKPTLNLFLYQGSMDVPVGKSYNLVCYSVMLHMFAHLLNMTPNRFSVSVGDAHIYSNQVEFVKEQLSRKELDIKPTLEILGEHTDPFSFKPEHLVIHGYDSHPHIKYPVAV